MNPLRKTYCRLFQACFRIALPVLPYREPHPLATFEEAAALLAEKGVRKPLIVTDGRIRALGLTRPLEEALAAQGIHVRVFDEVVPNPTIANVEAARAAYLSHQCDALIAFGSGSAMDCAKAAGARVVRPNKPVQKMRGLLKVRRKLPLFLAIPTTAGTGSETTLAAVITDSETHHKYPINDFSLIPHYAVLDYRTTLDLPPHVTATTGMDALVHAVEAYIGRSTTRETRARAVEATALIHRYLQRAYEHPHDAEARKGMLRAAYCAGIAFTKSYVGYVHGVAHSLGGQYGIAHGLANAVLLPYFLDEYGASAEKKLAQLAREAGIVDANEDANEGADASSPQASDDAQAARAFVEWVRAMNAALGIPDKLEGIREEDIPVMAAHADEESNPLYPVPKLMDAHELESMYYKVMTDPAHAAPTSPAARADA
ncbi:MAG: iron-containing alcohol dehydrogenase [Eggerthellaceae bacterium]|nr:iron-containing alcohol dehydrogenase [Eggerthellaceae bacterium]